MKSLTRNHPAKARAGFERERRRARYLSRGSAYITASPGLYGVEVRWRSCAWLLQARSSRSGVPRWLSRAERHQLLQCCQAKEANAIVRLKSKERTLYNTMKTRQRL